MTVTLQKIQNAHESQAYTYYVLRTYVGSSSIDKLPNSRELAGLVADHRVHVSS
jgi:hypothetical protein